MRSVFKVLLSAIVMGVFIPITINYFNFLVLGLGIGVGLVFGLIFYFLRSRLPTENPVVKSLILGLFLFFLPTYAAVSFLEIIFIFPPEIAELSSLFYVSSSALFGLVICFPSLMFGLTYWIISTEKVGKYLDNF